LLLEAEAFLHEMLWSHTCDIPYNITFRQPIKIHIWQTNQEERTTTELPLRGGSFINCENNNFTNGYIHLEDTWVHAPILSKEPTRT